MRRAIVHIGMPRTGSTSFQELLASVRPSLAAAGLDYPDLDPPDFGLGAGVNHQSLGEALDGRRPRSERTASLARLVEALQATQAETVLLSYEGFSVQRPALGVPALLRDLFADFGFAMEVAMVVKPQAGQLNSAYAHRAQVVRESRTFDEFCRRHGRSGRLDYHARLLPWLKAADGRVTAVPLRDARSDKPLLERLVRDLGLAQQMQPVLSQAQLFYATNRSPGPVSVEASRRLRALRVHRQFAGHPRLIGHVVDQGAWLRGLDPEPFRGNAPERVARIETAFALSNARFAAAAWGVPWESVVAAPPARPPNELAGSPIDAETEAQIEMLVEETLQHFAFRKPALWQCAPANALNAGAERLASMVGFARWRVA